MKKNKVLIVDDVFENRLLLSTIIKTHTDYEIYLAEDGQDVIDNIGDIMPDLILLDVMMPEMNGYEVAKILKNNETFKNIPIIFISALDSLRDKIKAFENGGIDYITKPFNADEVISRIKAHIELKNYYDEIQKLNNEINEQLELAKKIQKSILKENKIEFDRVLFYSKFLPYEKISGDFFDIVELKKNIYLFIQVDVTGHGIPAAFYTMMIKIIFNYFAQVIISPLEIVSILNNELIELLLPNYYPTAFIGLVDCEKKILRYTNAGHPSPLYYDSSKNEISELKERSIILGVDKNTKFEEYEIKLNSHDKFILFTDGLFENNLTIEELKKFIIKEINSPLNELIEKIINYSINKSEEKKFSDDVSILSFEIK